MIDKHGYKMHGLKKASGDTHDYGPYSPLYNEIFYDISTGEVWTMFHCCIGYNSWTECHDSNVIRVCRAVTRHMTMQEIADAIIYTIGEKEVK